MKEIVAVKIYGNIITNDLPTIIKAAQADKVEKFYDRTQMQFMSCCGLGKNWDLLAQGQTIFYIDSDGKPQWPKN